MHFSSALPATLMDFTIVRLSGVLLPRTPASTLTPFLFGKRPSTLRRIHQAAALTSPNVPEFDPFPGVPVSSNGLFRLSEKMKGGLVASSSSKDTRALGLVRELERRVEALDEATTQAEESASLAPYYTEEDLMAIYKDVLVVPVPQSEQPNKAELDAIRDAEAKEDQSILSSLEDRLYDPSGDIKSETPKFQSALHRILVRALEIVSRVEATRNLVVNAESTKETSNFLPISILSKRECQALVRASLNAGEGQVAELALEIMKRTGLTLPEGAVTDILKLYAFSGNSIAADNLLVKFLTKTPTEEQRYLHVRAHLNATPLDTLPTSALELLHRYEGQNAPAPMKAYTSVITSLFSRQNSLARAQAWDIFSHMRYVAHPIPDVLLYTLMIRACASPVNTRYTSEPEKALDLWTEMTQDQKISPTAGSYNAIILACAKSGTKSFVNEALRLARQMLDSHRDAHGFPAFRPDIKTFCALLEGAKRIGDLRRARWILVELVRGQGVNTKEEADTENKPVEINAKVMTHMFHTYAAYTPPLQRAATTLLEEQSKPEQQQQQQVSQPPSTTVEADDRPSFAHIPPQSRQEVIREVKALFQRIVEDRNSTNPTATATPSLPFSDRKFKNVEITTPLIASYLSVFYKHAYLEVSREMFWKIFEEHGVLRSLKVYVEALERCRYPKGRFEKNAALKFADELWIKWCEAEQGLKTGKKKPDDSRLIERAHVAMIRVLAITGELDRAMEHLKAFAARYPPNDIRTPTLKTNLRSTRTSLVGSRPLVRMTSETEVPDDHVPPLMTFRDISVLHHRLLDESRTNDLKYVTWLCKAYEWALRIRRDAAVKAEVREVEEKQITA